MNNQSMSDMTATLKLLAISMGLLTALLLLINILILILRPIARRNAARTDLDQIGQPASVIKTIRPGKSGQIRYNTDNGTRTANAESDTIIRNGHDVLILSVVQNRFRVRRLSEEERTALTALGAAGTAEPSGPAGQDPAAQPVLPPVGSLMPADPYELAASGVPDRTSGQPDEITGTDLDRPVGQKPVPKGQTDKNSQPHDLHRDGKS